MANYETLKTAIQQVVKTNGNNEITGALLQQSLLAMINSLGDGYQFKGVATPTTNPGNPDAKVFYLTGAPGTYTNFNGIVVNQNEFCVLRFDSQWQKSALGVLNSLGTLDFIGDAKGIFNYANAKIAHRVACEAITAISLYTKQTISELYLSQFGLYGGNFCIQFWDKAGSRAVFTLRIPMQSVPTTGVVTYQSSATDNNYFVIVTIDWSKYNGVGFSDPNVTLMVKQYNIDSDAGKVARNLFGAAINTQITDLENNVSLLNGAVGINIFSIRSRVGNITADGSYYPSNIGVVTYPIKVTPGMKFHYTGGWNNNPAVGLVWGYSDESLTDPTMLQASLINVDTDITIPSGINYIMAWSANDKPQILYNNADSLLPRVAKLEQDYINDKIGDKAVLSNNLFNKNTVTANHYVRWDNGRVDPLDGFTASDFIQVKPTTTYSQRYSQQVAFYNENKAYISGITALTDGKFTTPAGAAYVRITTSNANTPTQQINESSILLPFDEWGEGIPKQLVPVSSIVEPIEVTIVATRNAANYNSIREIMNGITDASATKKYIIFVPNGEWFECDIIGKKYVSIVGEDREKTILYSDGLSDKLTPTDYSWGAQFSNVALSSLDQQYKHCFRPTADIDVKNLTVRVNNSKYCAHLDNRGYYNIKFDNCHFIAQTGTNYPVGIGMTQSQDIRITNCILEHTGSYTDGVFAHNANNQGSPTYLLFENCYFKNCGFALLDELGSEQDDSWYFINCYSDRGGRVRWFVDNTSDGKTYWTNADGVKEPNPANVPYCIKANFIGCNVGLIVLTQYNGIGQYNGVVSRPKALYYTIAENLMPITDDGYNVGDVLLGYNNGCRVIIGNVGKLLGVVQSIVDSIAYVITHGCVMLSTQDFDGNNKVVGTPVYISNGRLTTNVTGESVGIISGEYGQNKLIMLY